MVTCAGGLNVDRILRLHNAARLGTSNPGAASTSPGGVARNIADRLARSGVATALFGAIGDDADGRSLIEHATSLGIDVDAVVSVDKPTGTYSAVIDPDGSLVIGVSDMAATEALRVEHLAAVESKIANSGWLIIDANLPTELIAALAEMAATHGCKVAANTVSVAKAGRIKGPAIDLVFCSLDEAEALSGDSFSNHSPQDRDRCRAAMSASGVPSAVVTIGADGAWFFDVDHCGSVDAVPTDATDTTGAGDALVGETVRSLLGGADLQTAVSNGVTISAEVIRHVGAAPAQTSSRVIT